MALSNWQLDQLVGRVDQQRWLERILRENIPERHGRTVIITGPLGSGRVALARFGLWQSLHALPRSIEIHAVDRTVRAPQEKDDQGKVVGAAVEALKDVGQRLPLPIGPLFAGLVSLWSSVSLEKRQQRLVTIMPSPQLLLTLIEDAAGVGPFALHITGLDDPSLDEQWIDAVVDVAKYIRERYPVLLLLSTVSSQPLSELEEWQMTPVQRRLRKLLDEQIIEAWHLGPVSVEDVQRYVHEPADEVVIRRLHERSGGWPLMVQALWRSWRNSAPKNSGGGSRTPVLAGDGFAEPWRFTSFGFTATAHVERLLDDLLDAYPDALEMLAVILSENKSSRDWLREKNVRDVLHCILSVATLEGASFTGKAVAHACDLTWEDGLEEVFDALGIGNPELVVYIADSYLKVPTPDGVQELYCYRFGLPVWWHLFHADPNFTDEERREAASELAQALETCYGPLAWRKVAQITALWERAGEFERVRFQRRVLEQLAYIDRLKVRAILAEQSAPQTDAWLDAHQAWLELAQQMRGYTDYLETVAAFESACVMAERGNSQVALAESFTWIAGWANEGGDSTRAEKAARKGLETLGDRCDAEAQQLKGRLLHEIGWMHHLRNELDQAIEYYEQARALQEVYGLPAHLATTLHEMGRVYHASNKLDKALNYYEQARGLKEAHGSPASLGHTLYQIGCLYHERDELDLALRYYNQAQHLWEAHGRPDRLVRVLYRIGMVYYFRTDVQEALMYYQQAQRLAEACGLPGLLATILHQLGLVHQQHNDLETALTYYRQAQDLAEACDLTAQLAGTMYQMGLIQHTRGNLDQALKHYEQARTLQERQSSPAILAVMLHQLGEVCYALGKLDLALEYFKRALVMKEQGSDSQTLAATLYRLTVVYLDLNNCQAALRHVRRALDIKRAHNLDIADEEALERRILEECQPSSEN